VRCSRRASGWRSAQPVEELGRLAAADELAVGPAIEAEALGRHARHVAQGLRERLGALSRLCSVPITEIDCGTSFSGVLLLMPVAEVSAT